MANTFEIRGHTLWYNPNYVQHFFVFSAVLKGRIQYYLFKERKTEEQIREAEAAIMQGQGINGIPHIINARGTGGPNFMKVDGSARLGDLIPKGDNKALLHARTRDTKVFVKVALRNEWGVFWLPWTISFNPMRHLFTVNIDEPVVGDVRTGRHRRDFERRPMEEPSKSLISDVSFLRAERSCTIYTDFSTKHQTITLPSKQKLFRRTRFILFQGQSRVGRAGNWVGFLTLGCMHRVGFGWMSIYYG